MMRNMKVQGRVPIDIKEEGKKDLKDMIKEESKVPVPEKLSFWQKLWGGIKNAAQFLLYPIIGKLTDIGIQKITDKVNNTGNKLIEKAK